MNSVQLTGRLTKDPEMKYSQGGTAITKFALAVDRRTKSEDGEKQTDFFDCTAFGKTAEFMAQFLDKGSLVDVEGRLQQERWTDKDTNAQRSRVTVVANSVQWLESKAEAEKRQGTAPAVDAGFDGDPFA